VAPLTVDQWGSPIPFPPKPYLVAQPLVTAEPGYRRTSCFLGMVNLSPIWPRQRVELVRRSPTNQWVMSGGIVFSGLNPR